MEKFPNNNENIDRPQNNREALGKAALEKTTEQEKFDDYIVRCANILGDAGIHTEGYYEPEDGDTYEDALKAGFEERVDDLKRHKDEMYNLFKNGIDLEYLLDGGYLYDSINDMKGYNYDNRESQVFESIRIFGNNYFGENVPQSDKELMKDILYGRNQDFEAQKNFLKSKDDVISRRILEDKEGLSDAGDHFISYAIEAANEFDAAKDDPRKILEELEDAKILLDKRKASGIEDSHEHSLNYYIERMKDIIEEEEFRKKHDVNEYKY